MNSYLFATFGLNPKYLLARQQSLLLITLQLTEILYFLNQSCTSKGRWTAFTGLSFDVSDSVFPRASPRTHPTLPPKTDSTRVWTTIQWCSTSFITIHTYNILPPSSSSSSSSCLMANCHHSEHYRHQLLSFIMLVLKFRFLILFCR